jgi:predicted dehydrogenase
MLQVVRSGRVHTSRDTMSTKTRTLKIGILGCGPIAQMAHFEVCRKACNTRLYAICDVATDLTDRIAAIHEPEMVYHDYDKMLSDSKLDTVIIATSDEYHVPLCLKAIQAGKHVLVEKPLGVNVGECLELQRNVRDSGLVLQVGHNRRFDPGVTYAREFIQQEIGQVLAMKAWYYDSTERYTMTDNVLPIVAQSGQSRRPAGDPKADRKRYFMLAHGSHLVDLARFLAGNILRVRARHLQRFESHSWFIDVEFEDGTLGHLDLIIPIRGDYEEGFRIFGENGSVQGRLHMPWYHKASSVECYSVKDGLYHRPLGADGHSYRRQLESFADSILNDQPLHGAGIDDGLAAVQAMAAISRSVESGDWINLSGVEGTI